MVKVDKVLFKEKIGKIITISNQNLGIPDFRYAKYIDMHGWYRRSQELKRAAQDIYSFSGYECLYNLEQITAMPHTSMSVQLILLLTSSGLFY